MTRRVISFTAALLLCALAPYANAQTTPAKKSTPPAKAPVAEDKSKAAARAEAKRLEEQRRATATALLISLADEARSYRDQTLRARIQMRAADILWETDTEKARALFRRSWDAADIADTESQRRFDEERRAAEAADKPWNGVSPPSLRTEVLRMAAKRDRALGEELLGKLDEARKQQAANASTQTASTPNSSGDPFELPPSLKLRLRLAQQLLETDVERATEFAMPALARVSVDGLIFLTYLRLKNAATADELYASMLARAAADTAADANTISMLSSYIFTPFVIVRFTPDGGTYSNQYDEPKPPLDIAQELRMAFIHAAEQVFLRPLPPPEQDHTTSGRTGKYLVMQRLMPFFEQYAPEQTTTLMKAQLTALARELPANREEQDEYVQRTRNNSNSPEEPEDSKNDAIKNLLDKIERSRNQDERDSLYAQAALMAVEKGDARAFDFADKIENMEMRKGVRAYVDFNATRYAVEKKRMEDALKLARTGALTNMQRVWVLTQIGQSYIKTDRETAIEILDEAAAEARRIGGSSADRPRALIAVATALYEVDRARAWDLMSEVVRAANNTAEEFTGEDARIVAMLQTKNQTSMMSFTDDIFDLPGIFSSLSKENLERAILLAKDFNGEAPRATALVSIARTTLEKKQETKQK